MILSISNNSKKYEIKISKINQWIGTDILKKTYILDSIEKYFSKSIYKEYENQYINNVLIDNNEVGRESFKITRIKSKRDLIDNLTLKKNTLIRNYIQTKMIGYDCSKILNKIYENIDSLFININKEIFNNYKNIYLDYSRKDLLDIIIDAEIVTEDLCNIECLTNYEMIYNVLSIIYKLDFPRREIIIFENIDHLLTLEEYYKVIQYIETISISKNIYFIITTSIADYVSIDEILLESIVAINDEIFQIENKDVFLKFLNDNYPTEERITLDNASYKLKTIMNYLGNKNYKISQDKLIMLKLINNDMYITSIDSEGNNYIKNCFIFGK